MAKNRYWFFLAFFLFRSSWRSWLFMFVWLNKVTEYWWCVMMWLYKYKLIVFPLSYCHLTFEWLLHLVCHLFDIWLVITFGLSFIWHLIGYYWMTNQM
jgi:hypothetical protein